MSGRDGIVYTLDPKDLNELDFAIETTFHVEKQTDKQARLQMVLMATNPENPVLPWARAMTDFLGYEDTDLLFREMLVEQAMKSPDVMQKLVADALMEAMPEINKQIQAQQAQFNAQQLAQANPALSQLIAEKTLPGAPGSEAVNQFVQQTAGMPAPPTGMPTQVNPMPPAPPSGPPLPPNKGPINGRAAGSRKAPGGPKKVAQPYTRG